MVVSAPEGDVFGHGEDRDQHEVLVHHADAGGHGVARAAEGDGFVVDEDLALGGLVESVQDVHQRGLAGAVLAEQTVNLPGFNNHVNVVVGYQGAEAFGDPLEFKFQNSDQSRSVRRSWRGRMMGLQTQPSACSRKRSRSASTKSATARAVVTGRAVALSGGS